MFTVGPPVFTCTLQATLVTIFNHLVKSNQLPSGIPVLEVSSVPFALTSSVLSLLLDFRTNSSYNRFDEARKLWASNVNRARDISQQALTWIRSPQDSSKLLCLLRHVKAYTCCLQDQLTEETTLRSKLEGIAEVQELHAIMHAQHQPNHVLQILSKLINQCNITEWEKMSMDENIKTFHDNVGACERISKMPIPIAYTLVTSRFFILWHLAVPFALWEYCGWLTIPASFLTSMALFYIEEVSVLIEEPFWILPLHSMTGGIMIDLDGLLTSHEASSMMWGMHEPSKDDVVQITIEGLSLDGFEKNPDIGHVVLRRMNSVA